LSSVGSKVKAVSAFSNTGGKKDAAGLEDDPIDKSL
jgi:hypothetical protein